MGKRAKSKVSVACPDCGEEFESGVEVDIHRVEAGPVCSNCGEHVNDEEWTELAGQYEDLLKLAGRAEPDEEPDEENEAGQDENE